MDQILWVTPRSLIPAAVLSATVVAIWFGLRTRLGRLGFYLLYAVTVTASVQLVGVYLVFASLILPALAAQGLARRMGLILGYGVGAAGYAAAYWSPVSPTSPPARWCRARWRCWPGSRSSFDGA